MAIEQIVEAYYVKVAEAVKTKITDIGQALKTKYSILYSFQDDCKHTDTSEYRTHYNLLDLQLTQWLLRAVNVENFGILNGIDFKVLKNIMEHPETLEKIGYLEQHNHIAEYLKSCQLTNPRAKDISPLSLFKLDKTYGASQISVIKYLINNIEIDTRHRTKSLIDRGQIDEGFEILTEVINNGLIREEKQTKMWANMAYYLISEKGYADLDSLYGKIEKSFPQDAKYVEVLEMLGRRCEDAFFVEQAYNIFEKAYNTILKNDVPEVADKSRFSIIHDKQHWQMLREIKSAIGH